MKAHRSHISSKEAKARGWSAIPSLDIRNETQNLNKEVGTSYMNGYTTWTSSGNEYTSPTTYHTWVDGTTWNVPWYPFQPTTTIREIIKEKVVTKEVEQRTLYRVYVIDPRKGGKILMDGEPVIAKNENQAMLKVGIAQIADKINRDIEQLDVYVEEVGTFIRPRKETQRVKITKEEED